MNTLKQRKEVQALISEAMTDIVVTLEEDRHYPSVREAGTAPTDSACDKAQDIVLELISKITATYGAINVLNIFEDLPFDVIKTQITISNHGDFSELTEVEEFIRDNGERKYHYANTVYHHKKENRYLLVEIQCTTDNDPIDLLACEEVAKTEKVTYEWSVK